MHLTESRVPRAGEERPDCESPPVIPEVGITAVPAPGCGQCFRHKVTSHTVLCQFDGDGFADVASISQFKLCIILLLMSVGRAVSRNPQLKKYKM